MTAIGHEFPGGAPRCIYCSTLAAQHERTACPGPQGQPTEKLRPEPARREYAVDDVNTISARLIEIDAARLAVLNQPPEEDGGAQH